MEPRWYVNRSFGSVLFIKQGICRIQGGIEAVPGSARSFIRIQDICIEDNFDFLDRVTN
jgi:hypothetical protein